MGFMTGRVSYVRFQVDGPLPGLFVETVDLLYDAFLKRRLGKGWAEELTRMRRWLQRGEHPRLAETA
jgi:hypothetical protein